MFTRFYASNETKRAIELEPSDRIFLLEETYTVTAYSVPRPGVTKLWVSPVPNADGKLPHNPVTSLTVSTDYSIELAD